MPFPLFRVAGICALLFALHACGRPLSARPGTLLRYQAHGDTFERVDAQPNWLFGENQVPPNRLCAFQTIEADPHYVFVDVVRLPRQDASDLAAWTKKVLTSHEPSFEGFDDIEGFAEAVPVYFASWADNAGRNNVEFAIVLKGHERVELYHRLVQDSEVLLSIRIGVHPSADPRVLEAWLHAFVDRPLGTEPPPSRISARGHKTRL